LSKHTAAAAEAALSRHVDLARLADGCIDARGLQIHFKHARVPGNGMHVILVHGLGLSCRYMLPTAQALMDDYSVLVPDLPGFGDSSKPEQVLDVNGLADSLAAWIERMRLHAHIALLGNSLACQIIAAALDRHPSVAHAAILQGPTTPPDERNIFWQLVRWRQNLRYDPADMKAISRDDYEKCGRRRVWKTFYLALHDAMEERLHRIHHPILVVRGERDPICSRQWALQVAEGLPHGTFVQIPEVAHTLVFTAPVQLAGVTKEFLHGLD
jgi:2-hydroxy-6-oxonona-2,4-dienedioate hydrolase